MNLESNGFTNIEYHAELFDTGLGETSRIESKIPRFRFMPGLQILHSNYIIVTI